MDVETKTVPPAPTAFPARASLEVDQVDLWLISLDEAAPRLPDIAKLLAPDERKRADKFYFARDRERYTATRGSARMILGAYLNVEPRGIRFTYNRHGKPFLDKSMGNANLRFNLSHSGGFSLMGVACCRSIGVDLEEIRPDFGAGLISDRHFTRREVSRLKAMPQELRPEAFFRLWTAKEAFVKGIGEGLSYPFNRIDLTDAIKNERRYFLAPRCSGSGPWTFVTFNPRSGYVGTVAVEGRLDSLSGPGNTSFDGRSGCTADRHHGILSSSHSLGWPQENRLSCRSPGPRDLD